MDKHERNSNRKSGQENEQEDAAGSQPILFGKLGMPWQLGNSFTFCCMISYSVCGRTEASSGGSVEPITARSATRPCPCSLRRDIK